MKILLPLLCLAALQLPAQDAHPIKRLEIGGDFNTQRTSQNEVMRATNTSISFRFGALNSQYRLTFDQRITLMDQRLKGATAPFLVFLEPQFGWRLGSRAHVSSTVTGPYLLTGFSWLGAPWRVDGAAKSGPIMYGFSAGIGTRFMLGSMVIRPELVAGHDAARGAVGETYWIPARNTLTLRVGYGFHFPLSSE